MKRDLQGHYVTVSTVGEKAQAFAPAPLPPLPPINWTPELWNKFDHVNKSLGHLERLGVVREITGRKRNRIFSYKCYVDIMNRGAELPER